MFKTSFLPYISLSAILESTQELSCQRPKSTVGISKQGVLMPKSKRKDTKKTAKQFKVPVSTIQSIVKKFNTVKTLQGLGWRATVSTQLARKIQQQIQISLRITTKAILAELSSTGVNHQGISRQTLQQTLHQGGLHGC